MDILAINFISRAQKKQLKISWDFPSDPVVKNPPCNAGDAGSIPSRETKIPRAVMQLSPRAMEPTCHGAQVLD